MNVFELYFSEHNELTEYEAINKGYRLDVYVKIGEEVFNLSVYTLVRLTQDFETEIAYRGIYSSDVNLVLVENTDYTSIINIIKECYQQNYFQNIKPCDIDINLLVKVN